MGKIGVGLVLVLIGVLFWPVLTREQSVPGAVVPQVPQPDLPASVQAAPSSRSFVPLSSMIQTSNAVWKDHALVAARVQEIVPDPRWMTPEPSLKVGDCIELALFSNAVFKAELTAVVRYENGAVGMTASLEDGSQGTMFLAYCNGQLRVSVDMVGIADYYVRYFPESGKHLAIEIDPVRSSVRECGDLKIPPVKSAQASSLSSAPVAVAAAGEVVPTGSTVVDVMIVYTPAALAMEGNTANMNANIAVAMQKANAAHSNSDTRIYLHLVRSEQVSYVESGDDGLDLDRLTWTSDGHMDNVHVLRDTYGADLVCLFSDTADVGGLGWLLTDESGEPEYAFCLAYIGQTDTGYTVVHEWGHNMGCSHSKSQAIEPWDSTDFRSYSAGWQWADAHGSFSGYCTVMTYQDWNNDGRREYERVPHFSNPNKSYNGRATGHVTDGDNARTMREMKAVYASYRATMVPPPPFETDVVTTYPYIESFKTGYGAWRGGTNIGAYWKRHAGATPQTASGPSAAAEGSNYVYSSSFTVGASTNLTAWFDFSSLTEPIFSWSYHMYGAQIGTLYLEISTDGDSWETLWWATGNLGDAWYRASVNLGGYGGQELVHVRFRHVVTAAGQKTEAAVDYITVEQKPLDIDLDGLPNEWELYYYGDETYADPAADDDGDGFSNLSEYIGGTDPWDPSSFFSVTALERADSAAGFVVHWNAVSGRVYSVNSSSNLLDGFQPLEENILYPQSSYTDAVQRAGQYYKVGVQLEP